MQKQRFEFEGKEYHCGRITPHPPHKISEYSKGVLFCPGIVGRMLAYDLVIDIKKRIYKNNGVLKLQGEYYLKEV